MIKNLIKEVGGRRANNESSYVVKFSKDGQGVITCDKTFAEIMSKIASGNDVIGYVTGADGMTYAMLPTIKAGTSGVVFSATFYDNDNKGVVYQVECYQSEGHDFFEWSVVELAGGGGDTPVEIALTEDNVFDFASSSLGENIANFYFTFLGDIGKNKRISIYMNDGEGIECNVEVYTYLPAEGYTNIFCLFTSQLTEELFFGLSPKLVIS